MSGSGKHQSIFQHASHFPNLVNLPPCTTKAETHDLRSEKYQSIQQNTNDKNN